MYSIVYDKTSGKIVGKFSANVDAIECFYHYSDNFKENLKVLKKKDVPSNWSHYKVSNGRLSLRNANEIDEIKRYGRVLSEEERQLNKLKPSIKEIQKAEQTIEILSLIQEVM